ncbi:MAG: hypothetical protein PHY99_00120 [Bacteroidales bacterium]|nr:hypothetical protein [Bacteroidales bacterium]
MISPVETWVAQTTGLTGNLNPETLHHWQLDKLKEQIRHAAENSRFYRDRLSVSTNLTDLPFTFPEDICDPLAFLAIPQSSVARITTLATSGTTGEKKRIFFSESDLKRTIDFFAAGMSTLVHEGQKALILISDETENSLGSLLKTALSGIGVSAQILGPIRNAQEAIDAAIGFDCLIGMPAEILYMSRTEPDLRPSSILLTADYVPQCIITGISKTWKCQVFTHYGLTEVGFGCAVDCNQHAGHHLRDADLIMEIIDPETGKPVDSGQRGEIVITTLSNEAMPLIRYRTGDISRLITEPCGCGGLLHTLGRIEGRYGSAITQANGKSFSIHQLDEMIFADPGVRGYQAMLESHGGPDLLNLTIETNSTFDLSLLAGHLPPDLKIRINLDKSDPFRQRGKRIIHID